MTCAHCNKQLVEQTVATKTKKIGEELIVLQSRQALVCAEHGVVAWDPPRPFLAPYAPYIPVIPYTPYPVPYVAPRPFPPQPWVTRPVWASGTAPNAGGGYGINQCANALAIVATSRVVD